LSTAILRAAAASSTSPCHIRGNPLAGLGFGPWQSGRTDFQDIAVEPAWVARWVAGYHARRRLGEQAATQLPFFLQARGCQLIAR
jgi:hypothetical protein